MNPEEENELEIIYHLQRMAYKGEYDEAPAHAMAARFFSYCNTQDKLRKVIEALVYCNDNYNKLRGDLERSDND